jgi:hypothetical protein
MSSTEKSNSGSQFNWDAAAKDMSFANIGDTKEIQIKIPLSKPSKERFCRVHPAEEYSINLPLVEIKEDPDLRGLYMVCLDAGQDLRDFLLAQPGIVKNKRLVFATYSNDKHFIWPLNLSDGHVENNWNITAMEGAMLAKKEWVRMLADLSSGLYRIHKPTGSLHDPEWPEEPFTHWLDLAFKGRIIRDLNHPVIRFLMGH